MAARMRRSTPSSSVSSPAFVVAGSAPLDAQQARPGGLRRSEDPRGADGAADLGNADGGEEAAERRARSVMRIGQSHEHNIPELLSSLLGLD